MLKTVRKRNKDGDEKTVGYVVTESGLVEDEGGDNRRPQGRRKGHKSLLESVTSLEEAKKKINKAERRSSSIVPEEPPSAVDRRRSSINFVDVITAKGRSSSIVARRKSSLGKDVGLVEAAKMRRRMTQFGSMLMVTKAVSAMRRTKRLHRVAIDISSIDLGLFLSLDTGERRRLNERQKD